MYCTNCGKQIPDGSAFCTECGARLNAGTNQQMTQTGSNYSSAAGAGGGKKKKSPRLFILIGIAVVVVIGLLALGSGSSEESAAKSGDAGSTSASSKAAGDAAADAGDEAAKKAEDAKEENASGSAAETTAAKKKSYRVVDIYTSIAESGAENGFSVEITDKAKAFLTEHDDLFPTSADSIDPVLIDETVDARSINKNSSRYGDRLIRVPGLYVTQIHETEIEEEEYFTEINSVDSSSGQQYYVMYNDELPGVYEGDFVDVIGVPIGTGYFENTENGQTLVIYIAAAAIQAEGDASQNYAGNTSANAATSGASQTQAPGSGASQTQTAQNRAATLADYEGGWDGEGGRWGFGIEDMGNGSVHIYYEGHSGASSGATGEYHGELSNGMIIYSDGVEEEYEFQDGGDETEVLTMRKEGCAGFLELRFAPFDPDSASAGVSVLAPSGEDFRNASKYILWTVTDDGYYANAGGDPGNTGDYLLPGSDSRYISEEELYGMSEFELKAARNEIFARHGRRFNNQDLQNWFDSAPWYYGSIEPEAFDESVLNQYEKANLQMIQDYESRAGGGNGKLTESRWIVLCEESVTLRTSPNTAASEITQIPLFASVEWVETAANGFAKVIYNGQTGYVLEKYLDEYEPQVWTGRQLVVVNCKEYITLRTSPSTAASEICRIPLGSTADYLDEKGDFYLISYAGQVGYALKTYLRSV